MGLLDLAGEIDSGFSIRVSTSGPDVREQASRAASIRRIAVRAFRGH